MLRLITTWGEAFPRAALFCDRDGVINRRQEGGYVTRVDQVEVVPTALGALTLASTHDIPIVIISNQGAVGRQLATFADVLAVTSALLRVLPAISAVYVCPHHPLAVDPEDRRCSCRKPRPGLFVQAATDLNLDLSRSAMIGDQSSDVVAAASAGLDPERILTVAEDTDPLLVNSFVTDNLLSTGASSHDPSDSATASSLPRQSDGYYE